MAWRWITAALLVALAWAAVRLAWLGDDAFITFRSVENLVNGHGPVWNVGERVQTYTHPLWFLLLGAARWITGECATTAQLLGIAISGAAVWLLLRTLDSAAAAATAVGLLLCSRAWTNYVTSGLETSLTFALLAALWTAWRGVDRGRRLARVALVCGLLGMTRLDLLLLGLPALAACLSDTRPAPAVRAVVAGLGPLLLWSTFASIYYGSPFPITAYAKAFCHGVPSGELVAQGMRYLGRSLAEDPITLAVILLGVVAGLAQRGTRTLAFGALVYSLYVVRVGGDYMLGRFWVPPFMLCVALLADHPWTSGSRGAAAALVGAFALAFLPGVPEAARPVPRTAPPWNTPADGIANEQLHGQWDHGLLARSPSPAAPGQVGAMLRAGGVDRRIVTLGGAVGWFGYAAGPQVHIVDPWLCDPLLMRLPLAVPGEWRIGHFYRRIPAGYLETVATGENRIRHPGLARLCAAVRSVTHDPLWSATRWRMLWGLWSGRFDQDLDDYVAAEYRSPPRIEVPLARLAGELPAGSFWSDLPAGLTAQSGGLAIRLPVATPASAIVLHVTGGASYEITFRRAGHAVGRASASPTVLPPDALQAERIPAPAGASPFDEIWVDARVDLAKPAAAFVGRIELVP